MSQKKMPEVGLGLWKIAPEDCAQSVYDAISVGYRHLDSACDYGNEKQVGEGIKRAIEDGLCSRDDLWITSKLWNTYHAKEHVKPALERTLSDLGLDYLDLYLIHFPIAQQFVPFETRYPPEWFYEPDAAEPKMEFAKVPLAETWHAMEALVDEGLIQEIGVCNYNSALLMDLMNYANVKPYALQIESHPYLTQEKLIKLAKGLGLHVTAFSPLGALSYLELNMAEQNESVLVQEAVKQAAVRTGKTEAQVVLRWNVQRGCAVIPKSSKLHRLKENLDIFDFSLNEDEMQAISALNANKRFNDPGDFCQAAFNTHCPIYD